MSVQLMKACGLALLLSSLNACGSGGADSSDSSSGDGDGGETSGDGDNGSGDGDQDAEIPTCLTTAECPDGGVCRNEECVIPESCSSADDCGINSECHPEKSVCVECLVGDHCAATQTCLGNVCRDACTGHSDCTDATRCSENGFCVECLDDRECADDEYCSQGNCIADVCPARSTSCTEDGDVLVCSERGDSSVALDCPADESCGTEQGPAWCQSWICTPDQSRCAENENIAETCSSDGLTIESVRDCDATNALCDQGECKPYICDPYQDYCKDGHVYACDAIGISDTLYDVCAASEYCDESLAICRAQVCVPGVVGCDGGQVATCNDLGSGFEEHSACDNDEVCELGACAPIVCDAHSRFCESGSVRLCNALGTADSLYDACTSAEFCNDSEGTAFCSPDFCAAGEPTCDGDNLGTCNGEGSGFDDGPTTDCTDTGQTCFTGQCEDVVCTIGQRLCVEGNVHQCVDRGSATQLYDACTDSEYCDVGTATCQPKVCTPSQPGCDGEVARTCNSVGSAWLPGGTNCGASPNLVCDAGACGEVVCTPNERFCSGTDVMLCNVLGTASTVESSCSASYHCYENSPTSAYCRVDQCTNGDSLCNGDIATICAPDGSGPLPSGTDCTATNQACWGGSCEDVVCDGAYECVGGDFHSCLENGTATALVTDCSSSQYCSETLGCRAQVCTPDSVTCGSILTLQTCNSDGSGYTTTGCATGERCWDGVCSPMICSVGETLCQGGDFHQCGQNGTGSTLIIDCLEGQYCDPTDGCLADVCEASQPMCNGELVTTCNNDGSAPVVGGTDCSTSGQACYDATCLPIVCTDGEYTCDAQELSQCVNNGTSIEVQDNCEAGSHCVADAGACLLDVCAPGSTACLDFDTVVACASDGTTYDLPGVGCSSGEVCDGGVCVAESSACSIAGKSWSTPTQISTISGSETRVGADLAGNVFAIWGGSGGLRVARYSSSDDAWTVEVIDAEADSFPAPQLAVSEDGFATAIYMVTNSSNFNVEVHAATYDPGLRTWSKSDALMEFDYFFDPSFSIDAALGGRFVAMYCDNQDGSHATAYSPEYGWLAPTILDQNDPYYGTYCALDLRRSGKAVGVWTKEGNTALDGVKWSTFDFSSGVWSPPQVAASSANSFDAVVDVVANDDLSEIWMAYVVDGVEWPLELHVNSWNSTTGLGTPSTIDDDFHSNGLSFVRTPGERLYLFSSPTTGVLPSGSSTWATESGRNPGGGAFAYAGGDMLVATNSITTHHYIEGTGWSTQSNSNRGGAVAPLDDCGAVWVYRYGSSGIYVSWLE